MNIRDIIVDNILNINSEIKLTWNSIFFTDKSVEKIYNISTYQQK